jgi:hypothetical protein
VITRLRPQMSRPIRRSALALLAAAAAFTASGCGNKTAITTVAPTEGIYLDLGGMKYQIQMSRYLNPADVEDHSYLLGTPSGIQASGSETWFGIWMRVQNETDKALPVATEYEIHDTQGAVYRPVPLDAKSNPFAYQAGQVAPGKVLPLPDSAAGNTAIQGSLLLFKIKVDSLQNRPLELTIKQGNSTDTADIDV